LGRCLDGRQELLNHKKDSLSSVILIHFVERKECCGIDFVVNGSKAFLCAYCEIFYATGTNSLNFIEKMVLFLR
jgi:hypothetical protein